jgi:peptide/nickel transport system substrate-binding protein
MTVVTGLQSCGGRKAEREAMVFRYNESSGIQTLDPAFARNQAIIWATNQLFNGLVELDADLNVIPALATDWEISSDGLDYHFTLRDDVHFHAHPAFGPEMSDPGTNRGRGLEALDFVYSFERLTDPETASPGAWVLQFMDSIWASGPVDLHIRLKRPFMPFLSLLTMKYCSVVPREVVEYSETAFRNHPVGTGPFFFKYWEENEKLVLRKNPFYFEKENGEQLPYIEAVSVRFIPDKQSAFLEFIQGRLDFLSGLDASYKDELLTQDGRLSDRYADVIVMRSLPYLNTEYLGILNEAELEADHPLRDKRIRQAINLGFDRVKMMRYLRNNIGEPAMDGMIPSALRMGLNSGYGYSYQPERAKDLVAQVRSERGGVLTPVKLLTNASYLDLCEFIQSECQKIGIPMEVEVVPPSTLRQMMATGKAAFFRASWIGDYPDPENYLSLFYSGNKSPGGPNYTRFEDEQVDSWYERALSEVDPRTRDSLYSLIDARIMERAVVVPLYYDQVLRFYPKGLEGLGVNPMNTLDLRRVRKSVSPGP